MSHLCMAVMHLPTNFCANSSIQFGVINIFRNPRWQPPPSWIFNLCEFCYSGVLIGQYLCSVPKLVQISVIVTKIDTHASDLNLMTSRELTSGFDFWSLVISASPWCIFPYNLMQDIFIQSIVIDIFPKLNITAAAILDFQFM